MTRNSHMLTRRSLVAAILSFVTAAVLALMLLAYLLDLWGGNIMIVEMNVPEVLVALPVVFVVLGWGLLRIDRLEQENYRLRGKLGDTDNYKLRVVGGEVRQGSKNISLTKLEMRLLMCLMDREGEVCSYEDLTTEVYQDDSQSSAQVQADKDRLRALVKRVRDRIAIHDYISTHERRGYSFVQWEG
jgi:DNA-binding winged helix-turn-helix (wHTH) protein